MSGENKSVILPLLAAGNIKYPEEQVKIQVNCRGEDGAFGNDSDKVLDPLGDLEILFPEEAETVPLIGGSILKMELACDKDIVTFGSDDSAVVASEVEKNDAPKLGDLNAKYDESVQKLKKYIKDEIPALSDDDEGSYISASNLVKARVAVNRALEEAPNLSNEWQTHRVPVLALSKSNDSSMETHKDLQKKITENQIKNIRLKELKRPVGYFKFVPISFLQKILNALVPDKKEGDEDDPKYGLKDYFGISGESFDQLKTYLSGTDGTKISGLDDDKIVKVLLELLPILRVDESYLTSNKTLPKLGYYTVYEKSVYLKTPDLSGRDSNGDAVNVYDLGEETQSKAKASNINYCLEFALNLNEYNAKSFEYTAPPAIEVNQISVEFPEVPKTGSTSGIKAILEIAKDGLDKNKISKFDFYLSPIFSPKSSVSSRGLYTTRDGVEVFTAPNLLQPYYLTGKAGEDARKRPVLSYPSETSKALIEKFSKSFRSTNFTDYAALFKKPESDATVFNVFTFAEGKTYTLQELGLPLTEDLSDLNIEKLEDILGEANRPEMLIGYRDGAGPISENERKFYDPKIYGSRNLLASNRPNIILDKKQLPSAWIPLKLVQNNDDAIESHTLEIPYDSSNQTEGPNAGLDLYNSLGALEFALYVVDDLGQIVRAPGKNIRVTPNSPSLQALGPDGFKAGEKVISLSTTLSPNSILAENSLTDWKIEGEGFLAPGTDPIIKFYSDEAGNNLITSIRNGQTFGADNHPVSYIYGEKSISISTKATFGDILPALVGNYYVGVQLQTGSESKRIAFYVADEGTKKDDLPINNELKIQFSDPFGIEVKGFGKAVNSIPIIQDSTNHANITFKANKKDFTKDGKLYAYLAFLDDKEGVNKDILTSDLGWLEGDNHKEGAIISRKIKTAISNDTEFLIPTSLGWEIGSPGFTRETSRRATLSFPGPGNININMNRFSEITAKGSSEYPAYILLVNVNLEKGEAVDLLKEGTGPNAVYDYAVVPIGTPGGGAHSVKDKPFSRPPEVLGLIAELPSFGGAGRVVSNLKKEVLTGKLKLEDKIEGLSLESLKASDDTLRIISSNGLKRLSVIFSAPEIARMKKFHNVLIGNKSIKDSCISVKSLGNGYVVANYEDINDIKSEGWTEVVVEKTDKRFKCSYDSTLYNKVTVDVEASEDGLLVDEDGLLVSKEDLLIPRVVDKKFYNYNEKESMSTVIFPGRDIELSPLPIYGASSHGSEGNKLASNSKSYYYFTNPVKLKPSIDHVFGYTEIADGKAKVWGMSLTDSPIKDGDVADEIIKIDRNGQTSVAQSISDIADQIKKAKEEAQKTIDNLKKKAAELEEGTQEWIEAQKGIDEAQTKFNQVSAEADDAVAQAEALDKQAADDEAMAAALANAGGDASGGSGVLDGAAAAAAEAAAAAAAAAAKAAEMAAAAAETIEMLNAAFDKLSSAVQALIDAAINGAEALASSLSSRPNDFVKVDLRYCYIDKSAVISPNQYISYPSESETKTKYKIIVSYKISQNAAIKFNVPEIVSAGKTRDEIEKYSAFGDNPFSKLAIKGDESLYIRVIGASDDTKYEVAGQRVNASEAKVVGGAGLYTDLKITIPSLNVLSVFGLGDCITISATNSNSSRMRLGRQMGNDLTINLEDAWGGRIFGEGRNQQGPSGDIAKHLEELSFLKFTFVKLGKVAGGAKEALQSFCDFSFHLTAELSLQLRNLQVLMIPIKVIFCIIDVICALLNPWRLAFAVIRLFLCLYDLILLLPPIAVPAMYLALLIHLLDLLLCVILKIISTINAINEVVTALDAAIKQKNYPAIVALEEALNEHVFSLETDLSVLEPIITILALFMELLQLAFAFPCRPGSGDPGDEACIDPSQLAGIILGKVAPTGKIAPNVLLPLAQAYTRLPAADTYSTGNSPPPAHDNNRDMSMPSDWEARLLGDVVVRPQQEMGSIVVEEGTPGEVIPNHINNSTGESYLIEEGGYFIGDLDGDGSMDNVYYPTLRTQYANGPAEFVADGAYYGAHNGYFDATFALSFTKSTKNWSFFTGPDPRVVRYEFNSDGVSSDIAWMSYWYIFPIFFSKKTVSELQTLDTPPMFLKKDDTTGHLVVDGSGGLKSFVSPIDGFDDFLIQRGGGFQPKPLTVTFELNEPGVNPDTFDAEFTPVTVTKTFGNIPMIAIVDDDFNVYFVEEDDGDGGIKMSGSSIESINLKMINYPSAPKKKTGKEKLPVFSNPGWTSFDSSKGETIAYLGTDGASNVNIWSSDSVDVDDAGNPLYLAGDNKYEVSRTGEAIMAATSNAAYIRSQIVENPNLQYNGSPASDVNFDYLIDSRENKRGAGEALFIEWSGTTVGTKTLKGETLTFTRSGNGEDYGLPDPDDAIPATNGPTGFISIDIVDPDVGLTGVGFEILWEESFDSGIPYPALGIAYDFGAGTSKEQGDIGDSIDSVKVFDFPQFYIVDMRQLADDIAAACGASGPAELLMDMPGWDEPFEDNIQDMMDCMQAFMDHFTSESLDDQDIPLGLIPKLRYALENGVLPEKISVEDAMSKYEVLRQCVEDQIDKSCKFVVNPLNTGFKLLGDTDETPLDDFIDPEQRTRGSLGSAGIVDELEFDEDLDGFPSITGAMEYASGIGDTIVAEAGTRAIVEFIPRDSNDDPMHKALDMTQKLKIDIVSDETGSAEVVPPLDNVEELVVRDEERYLMAVQTESPGKVVIRGSVCEVVIQAVTDKGVVSGLKDALEGDSGESAESLEGCVDEAASADGTVSGAGTEDESFAPGQLMKVDRNLTILFVPAGAAGLDAGSGGPGGLYGDGDRDASARSAKPNPQATGTKLEN